MPKASIYSSNFLRSVIVPGAFCLMIAKADPALRRVVRKQATAK